MRLTLYSDYSLRVLMYLAQRHERPGPRITVKQIADSYRISQNHLVKVVHQLSKLGWVNSHKGRNGGITLASKALDLTVAQIIKKTEPDMDIVECFSIQNNLCPLVGMCGLQRMLGSAFQKFMYELETKTLLDISGINQVTKFS